MLVWVGSSSLDCMILSVSVSSVVKSLVFVSTLELSSEKYPVHGDGLLLPPWLALAMRFLRLFSTFCSKVLASK